MKEYFTLDESLAFLNKDIGKKERISVEDLFLFAARGKIQPCFYYAGDLLWREEREQYNYMKGYIEHNFTGYLSHRNLGEYLHNSYKDDLHLFFIKFAHIYEPVGATVIPDDKTTVVLYDDFLHDRSMNVKYNQLSEDAKKNEGNFWAFAFSEVGHACIHFDKVFFHKKELLKLKSMNTSEDNEVEILKKRISELESLLASALRKTNTIKNINTDELTPDQEIPNTRTRGTVLKIIAILADMADLPDEPYTAFNMMEAHADSKGLKIPSKTPVTDWLTKARDSN
ncbi:hypothetical protein F967_01118 [Acinetobacter sp. CIP 102637]|uniref:hypothetical protein n=1 Tax=Acinetobacter sp. CIP 102637 TaxID=1144669 RepID=UPI0002D0E4AA|nr:hypothetical protein [Acinetobacter sp. CIP 102637]ENV06148.1 hypothetical protein F967_01118 [Acinetobacter sp. CIP 102637]